MAEVRYRTEVVAVGEEAKLFFSDGIVVLFGEDAPEELHEFSVIHRPSVTTGGIERGDVVDVGGERLLVLAVGDVCNDNLANLGHLVLKRNGRTDAPLPGDLCCDEGPVPPIEVGDVISVSRP